MADAALVAESGAHALGLNFSDRSARRVDPRVAGAIAKEIDGSLCRVGLFVDPARDEVSKVLDQVELDVLQFHGSETDAFCSDFELPYMKAHRVREPMGSAVLEAKFPAAGLHLLDAYVPGQPGGTGQRFDWQFWPEDSDLKLVLAGGLGPDNVAEAIARLRPFAVDVSGGVEGARKGEKDADKVRAFVAAVRRADAAAGSNYTSS